MATGTPRTLKDIPLFQDMDDADVEAMARVLRRLVVLPGETLFRRGERARTMFAIVEGSVDIMEPSPDGRNLLLATLQAGDVMGEVALIDGGTRTAAAIAREPTTCVTLDADGLERLVHERPEAARKLMLRLATNLAVRLSRAKQDTNRLAERLARGEAGTALATEARKSFWERLLGLGR
jgi:CRP-like cAMP-binding protein